MTRTLSPIAVALLTVAVALVGCSDYRTSGTAEEKTHRMEKEAELTVDHFRKTDPSLQRFFDSSAGYAVFPSVTKAAIGVGGARGEGTVMEGDRAIGYATLTQASIGVALGGQVYSELIFFETQADLDVFKQSNMHFSAEASAVAAARGAATSADYSNGVAVFTVGQEGLMFEASIGGQKFTYWPK